jgi:hypothetical protein
MVYPPKALFFLPLLFLAADIGRLKNIYLAEAMHLFLCLAKNKNYLA